MLLINQRSNLALRSLLNSAGTQALHAAPRTVCAPPKSSSGNIDYSIDDDADSGLGKLRFNKRVSKAALKGA